MCGFAIEETLAMRNIKLAAVSALLLSASILTAPAQTPAAPPPTPMTMTSTAFTDGGVIPSKFTQDAANPVSPALTWMNPPAATVSYTLVMHDVDNAGQKHIDDTLHWLIFNIPGSAHGLPEGVPNLPALPDGSQQVKGRVTGFMGPGFRGSNFHHYVLELYALDTKLDLGPDAARADVMKAMDGHVVGKAALVGLAHRTS
jgi:Raf kinase inhibitor-like YbhB/YbcL family protein